MFYVYVLRSENVGKIYIGHTADLKKRFGQHNKKLVKSTKAYAPWELLYYEAFKDQRLAKQREFKLKYLGRAYGQLKSRIGL